MISLVIDVHDMYIQLKYMHMCMMPSLANVASYIAMIARVASVTYTTNQMYIIIIAI